MGAEPSRQAVLIAGPTASGKSALALARARAAGGVVVNADAMQVYAVLRVVTARPSAAEMGEVPHRLYGSVPPERRFSTGDWLRAVAEIIAAPALAGLPLIFAGGTGLYFDALEHGFAEVPHVPAEITRATEREIAGLDRAGRAALLAARDPLMAERLAAPDPQRVVRALAVLAATGRSLASFQQATQAGLLGGWQIERLVLDPPRELLRERIARRFAAMFDGGAVEEVRALLALDLDPSLPAMKAIGVPEIAAMLRGELTEAEAMARAVTATQQYAKRQRTWFRNRMAAWPRRNPFAGPEQPG